MRSKQLTFDEYRSTLVSIKTETQALQPPVPSKPAREGQAPQWPTSRLPYPAEVRQPPPIVEKLRAVFDSLDDDPRITALIGPIRRGPKGHSVRTLWYCFVAKYVLGFPSTATLIRTLEDNPFIAEVCGISSPNDIPHKSTFSRFLFRLSRYNMAAKVMDVSRALVRKHYAELPGFGKRVAIDSTTLKGWVNGGKPKPSDPEARWSVKKNTHGRTEFVLGWKLHLMVDTEYELPVAANVSPGDVHDSQRASNLLAEARFTHIGFPSSFTPRWVMADQGYSGRPLFGLIRRKFCANPIIQVNKAHKRLMATEGLVQQTPGWKALYAQRGAVERAFSRLKGQRSLNHVTVRRLRKVTLHCYLSLIAMQAIHGNK